MTLSGIGSRAQLATNARLNSTTSDDSPVRVNKGAGTGDGPSNISIALLAGGGIGVVGGLALRFAGLGKVGTGIAALGGALLGASLLSACAGSKRPPVPGDEGAPGGSVSIYPSTLTRLPHAADTTNPAPASYEPRSGSRDAREGVVLLSRSGGTGSGWVIEPGTIITNYHVVHGHRELTVTDHAGKEHEGVVRKLDRAHDLAIVDAPTLEDAPLELDDVVDHQERGETTGYPRGKFSNDRAIATGEVTINDDGRERSVLFFDGTSDTGVSGGAVINGAGEVLGTSFAIGKLSRGGAEPEPFVLAIPNEHVQSFLRAPTPGVAAQ